MFRKKTILLVLASCALFSSQTYALSVNELIDEAKKALSSNSSQADQNTSTTVTNIPQTKIAIGFSPEGSAQNAIVDLIDSSQSELRVAAYSFTSPVIVKALIMAKKRGVDVKIIVDANGNKGKSSVAAMNLVVNAGISLRTISKYAIHHDKFIVADRKDVETGSYNYSASANSRNSENAIVLYDMPQVAKQYLLHWQSRWNDGTEWHSSY